MRRPSRRTLLAGIAAVLVPLPALAQTATKEKIAAALLKLEEFTRQVIDRKLVPGLSIALVHRDEVAFLGAFGVRQVGRPEPVDTDTVFQLASLSKPLASTVVSALVSDGKVSWDSRIRDIDPGFALQDELATAAHWALAYWSRGIPQVHAPARSTRVKARPVAPAFGWAFSDRISSPCKMLALTAAPFTALLVAAATP
jgi:CubicO group peptidase (beta-lactamase class C family)